MNIKLNKILAAFLIVMLALVTLTGCLGGSAKNADKPKQDYSSIEMNPNISIPGYESLSFKAGKKKQSVNFYNPAENTCYFRISLGLKADDIEAGEPAGGGEAKEEALWTSELLEPGESIKSIELTKGLESGEYPAVLKYECFSLKDETPLNGSKVELTLKVR